MLKNVKKMLFGLHIVGCGLGGVKIYQSGGNLIERLDKKKICAFLFLFSDFSLIFLISNYLYWISIDFFDFSDFFLMGSTKIHPSFV